MLTKNKIVRLIGILLVVMFPLSSGVVSSDNVVYAQTNAGIPVQVYFNDFDGDASVMPGVTATLGGVTSLESVQGYDAYGFEGDFLRNDTGGYASGDMGVPGSPTTLTLTGLPPHTSIDINFLLAVIDSWDGDGPEGCCHPDILTITMDGDVIFSESLGSINPSFLPPPDAVLTEYSQLGFKFDFADSAYDMGLYPAFEGIPHSASTLTIEWFASGDGWQGGYDESWAIDNLEIVIDAGVEVDIDIKPDDYPNSINCENEKEVITVALLTTEEFDAMSVDHTTVTFEGASKIHVNKNTGEPQRHEEDVDLDGDMDLVFHFRYGDTALTCDSTEGFLSGMTVNNLPWVGGDSVRMIDHEKCLAAPAGLVSWWPGDESPEDIADNNDGILIGDATYAPGMVGQAFAFDGEGDYVMVPRADNLDVGAQLTIDFWMKADPSNLMEECCQGLVTTDFYELAIAPGAGSVTGVMLMVAADDWVHSSDLGDGGYPLISGEWYHVAGVYDGVDVKFYVNGQLVVDPPPQTGNIAPMLETSFLAIGSEDGRTNEPDLIGNRYFHGLIDEVDLYNRSLSESEIQAIYNAGSAGKCK